MNRYHQFIDYLFTLQDLKYKEFHYKLLKNDDIDLIGIRTPILKEIAKKISKDNYLEFIKLNTHKYYEEIIIHGLLIGYLKLPFNEVLKLIDEFLPFIDNWAVNDLTVSNLKIFKKNKQEGFKYINKLLNSNNPWYIRFGLVLLLTYYIDDDYIDLILDIVKNIKNEKYYVKMSCAWLISICYIKYPNKTLNLLKNKDLDNWTHNKTISKICDSYRVDKKDKDYLKTLKT